MAKNPPRNTVVDVELHFWQETANLNLVIADGYGGLKKVTVADIDMPIKGWKGYARWLAESTAAGCGLRTYYDKGGKGRVEIPADVRPVPDYK